MAAALSLRQRHQARMLPATNGFNTTRTSGTTRCFTNISKAIPDAALVRRTNAASPERGEVKTKSAGSAPRSSSATRHAGAPDTHSLEEDLRRALGTKVELYRSQRGGKIIIEFYSDEELETIYEKLVG